MRGDAQTRHREHSDEGALLGADKAPGGDHQDSGERTHIEDHDAHRHGVNSLGQGALGVLGFSHSRTNELGAHEGEECNLEGT